MDLSKIPYGNEIKKTLNAIIVLAKRNPELIPIICNKINIFLKEEISFKPKIQIKNEYVAVVGILHGSKEKYISYASTKDIKLEFFNEIEKIKNGLLEGKLESKRCIGIIWGEKCHSISGNPSHELEYKSVNAYLENGELKLTIKSFQKALDELLKKNKSP